MQVCENREIDLARFGRSASSFWPDLWSARKLDAGLPQSSILILGYFLKWPKSGREGRSLRKFPQKRGRHCRKEFTAAVPTFCALQLCRYRHCNDIVAVRASAGPRSWALRTWARARSGPKMTQNGSFLAQGFWRAKNRAQGSSLSPFLTFLSKWAQTWSLRPVFSGLKIGLIFRLGKTGFRGQVLGHFCHFGNFGSGLDSWGLIFQVFGVRAKNDPKWVIFGPGQFWSKYGHFGQVLDGPIFEEFWQNLHITAIFQKWAKKLP